MHPVYEEKEEDQEEILESGTVPVRTSLPRRSTEMKSSESFFFGRGTRSKEKEGVAGTSPQRGIGPIDGRQRDPIVSDVTRPRVTGPGGGIVNIDLEEDTATIYGAGSSREEFLSFSLCYRLHERGLDNVLHYYARDFYRSGYDAPSPRDMRYTEDLLVHAFERVNSRSRILGEQVERNTAIIERIDERAAALQTDLSRAELMNKLLLDRLAGLENLDTADPPNKRPRRY